MSRAGPAEQLATLGVRLLVNAAVVHSIALVGRVVVHKLIEYAVCERICEM